MPGETYKALILKYYIFEVGLGQETALHIDAMLISPDTITKGGGPHVFSFLICAFVSEL